MSDDTVVDTDAASDESDLGQLLDTLSLRYNFDFREYKQASLARRVRNRMSQVHVDTFAGYANYLAAHPDEHVALFNTILINVTGFFRDPEAWKIVATHVVPRIVADAAESRSIRIWSAGCSSGEEPYSFAMLLAEHLGDSAGDYLVKIYGTDVDEDALTSARRALYHLDQLKDVAPELIEKYFHRDNHLYRLKRDLRRWCIFGAHNLTQAPPMSHIDLLICRNVLIYFTTELQDRILARFHYAIRDNGFLFLGRSESLLARSRIFAAQHPKWRVFKRASPGGRPLDELVGNTVLPEPERAAAVAGAEHAERAGSFARAQRTLDALPAAVMTIDMSDTILTCNPAAEQLFDIPVSAALTRKFRDLDMSYRVDGLRARIEDAKARHAPARIESTAFTRRDGRQVHADITVAPLFDGSRLVGVILFGVDATEYARLKEQMTRVAEQHATAIEELQSTNEELETTNEELQSTNEELETTNEELQSTNEELETTVEELQAANADLGALNTELEARRAELNRLANDHTNLINSFESGLIVLDRDGTVRTWNHVVERMWGLRAEQTVQRDFFSLPVPAIAQLPREPFERVWRGTSVHEELREVTYSFPGGQSNRALLRLAPLRDGAGAVAGVVGLVIPDAGAASASS